MHMTEFHVVLVDDEPDVHEITRLALRNFRQICDCLGK